MAKIIFRIFQYRTFSSASSTLASRNPVHFLVIQKGYFGLHAQIPCKKIHIKSKANSFLQVRNLGLSLVQASAELERIGRRLKSFPQVIPIFQCSSALCGTLSSQPERRGRRRRGFLVSGMRLAWRTIRGLFDKHVLI